MTTYTITLQSGETVLVTAAGVPVTPPTPVPVPPSPTPSGTLATIFANAGPGAVVDLGTTVYTAGGTVTKPLTVRGGAIKQAGMAIAIKADDVTFEGTQFIGGNQTVQFFPGRRRTLRRCNFSLMTETSLRLWPGAHDTLIEATNITQSIGVGYSPIGANDLNAGVGTFQNLTVRGGTIDNGPPIVSHFGIEVWGVSGLVIEDVVFKGSDVHISIPRSDGAIIRRNDFDLALTPWAGIELSDVENVQVIDNTARGKSATGAMWNAFVQLHPGSGAVRNVTIARNRVTNMPALLNAAGDGHTIIDNCLTSVGQLQWGSFAAGAPVTIARNGPAEGPCKP